MFPIAVASGFIAGTAPVVLAVQMRPTATNVAVALLLPRPDTGAEYCDKRVCLSVCLSVRDHIFGTARPAFTKFFYASCQWPWLSPTLAA